jgi:CheY-like chemotaxis protein
MIEIEVWDTGPGIPPDDQSVIFEEFRRLQRGGQGLGLGLSIAERIARLLEHPLRLRSELGRGTVFSILVPAAPPGAISSPALPEAQIDQTRLKVLVVDNDADVLRAMQALLQGWGCEVLMASTASQAEHIALHETPDLWLLDFHLDDNEVGLDVLSRLRALGQERPCIFITADQSESVRTAILSAGAQVLNKPLKPLALRSLMRRLCGD